MSWVRRVSFVPLRVFSLVCFVAILAGCTENNNDLSVSVDAGMEQVSSRAGSSTQGMADPDSTISVDDTVDAGFSMGGGGASGGSPGSAMGGAPASGGALPTAGASVHGGSVVSGGRSASGGVPNTGGSSTSGGRPVMGGSSGMGGAALKTPSSLGVSVVRASAMSVSDALPSKRNVL